MRQLTPEQVRVRSHADRAAYPALAHLRAALTSGAAAEREFWEWLAEPYSQMMARAVEELADNPAPLPCDTKETLLVQYGITTGLQLAAKLMTSPNRVLPALFRDPDRQDDSTLDSYTDTADSVIDNL